MQGYVAVAPEEIDDLLHLARTQETGVDQDADQLVADRLVQQERGNCRIDAAREAADHPAGADLRAHPGDRLLAERRHGPGGGAARDPMREIGEQLVAARRVHDLGVELHAKDAPAVVGDRGERRALRDRDDAKALRQLHHLVAVAHPDLLARADLEHALEQGAAVDHLDERPAELAVMADLDLAAELGADGLLAIADTEHRHALREHRLGCLRRTGRRGRGGPAGQDDGLGRESAHRIVVDRAGQDLAIDACLADAPRDQLGVLRAEIEDQDALGHAATPRRSRRQAGSGCLAPGALLPTSMPSMLRSSSISGQCSPNGDSS